MYIIFICLHRMDEILRDLRRLRREQVTLNSYPTHIKRHLIQYPESFPARLIATSLPMEAKYIQSELKRQLQGDQDVLDDVASGRKHLLETVRVDTMQEYATEVNCRIVAELLGNDRSGEEGEKEGMPAQTDNANDEDDDEGEVGGEYTPTTTTTTTNTTTAMHTPPRVSGTARGRSRHSV